MKLSVVMPAFNERHTIREIVQRVLAVELGTIDKELIDFAAVLEPGGRLVVLVPALSWLYGSLDVHLNHFRRYDRDALRALVSDAGFQVERIRFLNRPGVFGWWLNSRVLKRRVLPRGQLAAFRWLYPLLRLEERKELATRTGTAGAT